jgi:GTPase
MAQVGVSPPRFAIQVNSRGRLTRDYAYFVENRLRERFGFAGVPLVIDFVERRERRGGGRRGRAPGDGTLERPGAATPGWRRRGRGAQP